MLKKLLRTNKQSESEKLILFTLGSGITYYAFERFSMSTVYEFFDNFNFVPCQQNIRFIK